MRRQPRYGQECWGRLLAVVNQQTATTRMPRAEKNELHAHPTEDHVFVILQGSARFYGPDGETQDVARNQGFMMPKGVLYRFNATSTDECLVMLRVGTPNFQKQDKDDRLGQDGQSLVGDSKENKQVPVIFKDGIFFGA